MQVAYQRGTAAFGQRSTQGDTLFLKATTVFWPGDAILEGQP